MEEELDLSEIKVMDENGEAQPVELPQKRKLQKSQKILLMKNQRAIRQRIHQKR